MCIHQISISFRSQGIDDMLESAFTVISWDHNTLLAFIVTGTKIQTVSSSAP